MHHHYCHHSTPLRPSTSSYVDGQMIANHTAGGFTPFWASIPASAAADRTIVVMASNVFDRQLTPTQFAGYDFYQYGGLIREVTLHVLPKAPLPHVQRVTVAPLGTKGAAPKPTGKVDVSVVMEGGGGSSSNPARSRSGDGTVQLQLCWDIPATAAASCNAAYQTYAYKNNVVSIPSLTVPDAKVWDTAAPALHTLTVSLADKDGGDASSTGAAAYDSVQVRFGLRIVSASGRKILVNGKAVKLHGYNRHDMYPQVGPSMTTEMYDADLELLQGKLQGNFIRGAHYPQGAQRTLDYFCSDPLRPLFAPSFFLFALSSTTRRVLPDSITHGATPTHIASHVHRVTACTHFSAILRPPLSGQVRRTRRAGLGRSAG